MKPERPRVPVLLAALAAAFACTGALAADVDESAAQALMKKSGCLKCHAIAAKKDAPSYKEIAAKYKGKPDAERQVTDAITTSPKIKVDGGEEVHEAIQTKDAATIKNVVQFILTR